MDTGWGYAHEVDICFPNNGCSVYFFQEHTGEGGDWRTSYITHNNKKILDSRDEKYVQNGFKW